MAPTYQIRSGLNHSTWYDVTEERYLEEPEGERRIVYVDDNCQLITGEQLYKLVSSGFERGSFPWHMVSMSGKASWDTAAANLIVCPDTIVAKLLCAEPAVQNVQAGNRQQALKVTVTTMWESNGNVFSTAWLHYDGDSVIDGYEFYTDKIKGRVEYEAARLRRLLNPSLPYVDILSFDTDAPSQPVAGKELTDTDLMNWLCDGDKVYWVRICTEPDQKNIFNSSIVGDLCRVIGDQIKQG